MHNCDDKYPTRPGFEASTSEFRATAGPDKPSGPARSSVNSILKYNPWHLYLRSIIIQYLIIINSIVLLNILRGLNMTGSSPVRSTNQHHHIGYLGIIYYNTDKYCKWPTTLWRQKQCYLPTRRYQVVSMSYRLCEV